MVASLLLVTIACAQLASPVSAATANYRSRFAQTGAADERRPAVLASHDAQTCAVTVDRTVQCWGFADAGEQPFGDYYAAVTVFGASDIERVVALQDGGCAVRANGRTWCFSWKPDSSDQPPDDFFGRPRGYMTGRLLIARERPDLEGLIGGASGVNGDCMWFANGGLWCRGAVVAGFQPELTSRPSMGLSDVVDLAMDSGGNAACYIRRDGGVGCFGIGLWTYEEPPIANQGAEGQTVPRMFYTAGSAIDRVAVGGQVACARTEVLEWS
jgi:hypothetical protein